jgi:ketosteroid isomerase-like protein
MAENANTRILRNLWDHFEGRKWDRAAELLHPDFVADWPHTRERICGRENFIHINRHYPEPWKIEVVRIFGAGNLVVSELAVRHPAGTSFCCSVAEIQEGQIFRATEYWADDDHEVPDWRSQWVERF